jgi:hypothetical protein
MFLFSLESVNGLVQESHPIVYGLFFGMFLNRFKIKTFLAPFHFEDKVFAFGCHFYCFGVKVEKLLNGVFSLGDL